MSPVCASAPESGPLNYRAGRLSDTLTVARGWVEDIQLLSHYLRVSSRRASSRSCRPVAVAIECLIGAIGQSIIPKLV